MLESVATKEEEEDFKPRLFLLVLAAAVLRGTVRGTVVAGGDTVLRPAVSCLTEVHVVKLGGEEAVREEGLTS